MPTKLQKKSMKIEKACQLIESDSCPILCNLKAASSWAKIAEMY